MATTKTRIRITPTDANDYVIEFVRPDESIEYSFDTADVHSDLRGPAFAYGIKQILQDGGAVGKDIPAPERRAQFEKRASSLVTGTWSYRDGHGTPKDEPDYAKMLAALISTGTLPDVPEVHAAWKAAKPAERRAMLDAAPDARAAYEASRPAAKIDGAALLARLTAKA